MMENLFRKSPLDLEDIMSLPKLFSPPISAPQQVIDVLASTLKVIEEFSLSWLKAGIAATLREVTRAPYAIEVVRDPDWGYTVVVTLGTGAREALEEGHPEKG